MITLRKAVCTLFVIAILAPAISTGFTEESICDLTLTRPCRSNASLCVALEHINDGFIDCPDGSDEECEDWQHECLCGYPRCIDKSRIGDGVVDCVEGSDELAIEKESYICPPDLLVGQEIFRKRRHVQDVSASKTRNAKITTNFFAIREGITLPTGVLTSTVDSFINKGTTSEYLTHIRGVTSGGRYAQITSYSSRTFFVLPTQLNVNQVDGLISSVVKTTVVGRATHTLVSRVYHTYINGAYAQLVETETLKYAHQTKNYVTILQGEELQGTFVSNLGNDVATLQFSHLQGSLNPEPVVQRIVTVTGTQGQFIKEGGVQDTTFTVFTGSYVKDDQTFVFFLGNSALPDEAQNNGDSFMGEGLVDGHKMGGVFIANSQKANQNHVHAQGDTKMLTVTIGEPSLTSTTLSLLPEHSDMKIDDNLLFGKEMDQLIPRARKIPDAQVFDVNDISPTNVHHSNIPTYVINNPDQNIGDLFEKEIELFETQAAPRPTFPVKREQNIVDDIRNRFNIDTEFVQSDLPTVTYYGFAEFTTTIADTVVVFSPSSRSVDPVDRPVATKEAPTARIAPSTTTASNVYSTATTTVYNTVDLYPSGLVSSIGGTLVKDEMTTLFTTLVYGTYISGQYAQVVRSTSSIYYLVSRSASPEVTPTQVAAIQTTRSPELPAIFTTPETLEEPTTENMFDSFFDDIADNTIGRSVAGGAEDQIITDQPDKEDGKKVLDSVLDVHPTITTYTLYTTLVKDGTSTVSTNFKTTTAAPEFKIVILSDDPQTLSTLTYHTTQLSMGTTQLKSTLEVLTNKIVPSSSSTSDFFEMFTALSGTSNTEAEESFSEITTESTTNDATESTGLLLESSLNSGNNIEAQFFPRTYYTTYTYFTTYHSLDTSAVVSSLKTITNVVSDENQLSDHRALTPIVPTYPVTYWTTFTYWTTLVKDNTSITTSAKKTVSSVVNLTGTESAVSSIHVTATTTPPFLASSSQDSTVISTQSAEGATTYYTTYTTYTTAIKDDSTYVTSVLKTDSNIVSRTMPVAEDEFNIIRPSTSEVSSTASLNVFDVFGFLSEPTTTSSKTGLLSTLRGSTVLDGTTTIFSTNVYGSYVDGLYVQIQSTTSRVQTPFAIPTPVNTAMVATANIGQTIANQVTTHYTTQYVVQIQQGSSVTNILSTSSYEGNLANVGNDGSPTMTGTVKEIIGSLIKGTKTTYYHTTVVGTVVGGIYAQKVESTSRLVSGPSQTFDIISESVNETPVSKFTPSIQLESSINLESVPTTTTPTTILESSNEEVIKKSTSNNRQSFPSRSRTRNDVFAFIRRTSTFQRAGILTKGFFAQPQDKKPETETKLPFKPTAEPTTTPSPFRFGGDEPRPNLRFRFNSPKEDEEEEEEEVTTRAISPVEFVTSEKPVEKPKAKQVESETESSTPLRQFRFQTKKTAGTRSSPPFSGRDRKQSTKTKDSPSRFRFEQSQPKPTTTPKPKQRAAPSRPRLRATPPRSTNSRATPPRSSGPRAAPPRSSSPRAAPPRSPPKSPKKQPETPPTSSKRTNLFSALSRPGRKPTPSPRQRTFRVGDNSGRRRPTIPRLRKEESQIDPVYVDTDGTELEDPNFYDIISFTSEDAISRKKRQAESFGSKTSGRGARRATRIRGTSAPKETPAKETPAIEPAPTEGRQQFTIANPRFVRARGRGRDRSTQSTKPAAESAAEPSKPKVASPAKTSGRIKQSRGRVAKPRQASRGSRGKSTNSPPKSRNTLPFRPRRPNRLQTPAQDQRPKQSFRRPSSDSRLKVSNRFTPSSRQSSNLGRRKSQPPASSRSRVPGRRPPSKSPTRILQERPKPVIEPEQGAIRQDADGSINIVEELTVTRAIAVTTTIPLLESGRTVEKQVITASYVTEIIRPNQITQTEISGQIKLLLSTVENEMKVTQIFIQPLATTLVTFTETFIEGRRTSHAHVIPSTVFNIVTVTTNIARAGNGVNDLLKLFLLQQQQQNPLLAALGLAGQQGPSTYLRTSVYTTTVTKLISTEIPIIFRGKTIKTTVVDSHVEVITTTDITTETVSGGLGGFGQSNPLLGLIQGRQKREASINNIVEKRAHVSVSPELNRISEQPIKRQDLNSDLQGSIQQEILLFDVESKQVHMQTPSLEVFTSSSKDLIVPVASTGAGDNSIEPQYFLGQTSAELSPLTRNVRSAQRGRNSRQRNPEAREIQQFADIKSEANGIADQQSPFNVIRHGLRPTTYFTTFTYYTTLVDEKGREFIRSSEETITQIKTHGNVRFDDFTKTNPSKVKPIRSTQIPPTTPLADIAPKSHFGSVSIADAQIIRANRNRSKQTTLVGLVRSVSVVPVIQDTHVHKKDTRRRVRITVTKKRTVDMSKPAHIVDQTTIDSNGKKRVVITRRLPRPQPTAVATPINPYTGTVNTLYTVYSYLYSMVQGGGPVSYSSRIVTVSNTIHPTLVTVPDQFRTVPTLSLYTIEEGQATSTLAQRITEGITTQIYLASATLAQVRPDTLIRSSITQLAAAKVVPTSTFGQKANHVDLIEETVDASTAAPKQSKPQIRAGNLNRIQVLREQSRNRNTQRRPVNQGRQRGSVRFSSLQTTTPIPARARPTPPRRQPSRTPLPRRQPSRSQPARRQPSRSQLVTTPEAITTTEELNEIRPSLFPLDDLFSKISTSNSATESDIFTTTEEALKFTSRPRAFISRFQSQRGRVTDSPVTDSPVTDSPVTDSPVTDSPVTNSPVTYSPVTDSPVTDSPVTESHRLDIQSTSTSQKSVTEENTTEKIINDDDYLDDDDYYYYYYDDVVIPENNATTTDAPAFAGLFPQTTTEQDRSVEHNRLSLTTTEQEPALTTSVTPVREPTTEPIPLSVTKSSLEEESQQEEEPSVADGVYETFTTSTLLPILGGEQSITLTLLTSTLRTHASTVESTLFESTSTPSSTLQLVDETSSLSFEIKSSSIPVKSSVPTGRAVEFGDANEQLIDTTGRGLGAQFSIIGRPDLSTKTMDNGVQVIVADDKPRPASPAGGGFRYRPSSRRRTPAITLPPSTLLNQMVLVPSKSANVENPISPFGEDRVYQVNTFYTTFTYYNTFSVSNQPHVVSSTDVVSNVVSSPLEIYGNFVENTKFQFETRTYFSTQTFTRTVGDSTNLKTVSSEEVITQVIVTEAPTVVRSSVTPLYSTLVTKTYFTTYTYFSTIINGDRTAIDTNMVISSEVVTETGGIITKAPLPQISLSAQPAIDVSKNMLHRIYATKTYFTTSTYLTTILDKGQTVTSSHTEVTSNIVTEPIHSSLSGEQLLSIKQSYSKFGTHAPSTVAFENVGYVPLGKDVYQELKTLYATYTHFTTLPTVGEVISREVTKTNVLTKVITTSSVPLSLILSENDLVNAGAPTLLSNTNGFPLDPSYVDVSASSQETGPLVALKKKPSQGAAASNNLKATVLIEGGSESGTLVVKDSVTSATLLVKPTETKVTEATNAFAGLFDSIFDTIARPDVTIESEKSSLVLTTSVLTPVNPSLATRLFEDTTTEQPESETEMNAFIAPVRANDIPEPVSANVQTGSSQSDSTSETESEQGSIGGFGLSFAPMLTAMAGIIGNTFVGRLAGQADNAKRKNGQTLLPKNAIVSANQEPNFIPLGAMAGSRDDAKPIVNSPEYGFIPLQSHDDTNMHQTAPEVPTEQGFIRLSPTAPRLPLAMQSFGPTFRPPLVTESGFTAMTEVFNPTRVSVISGEETIFFDGIDTFNAHTYHRRPHPVPVRVPFPQDLRLSPTKVSQNSPISVVPGTAVLESSKTLLNNDVISSTDVFDQFLAAAGSGESTHHLDVTTSVGLRGEEIEQEAPRSTLVQGDSTLLSGKTTIYDSLFTRPVEGKVSVEFVDITSLDRGANGRLTKYITHTEMIPQLAVTTTAFKNEFTLQTEVMTSTLPLRTLVTTIVGSTTQVSTLTIQPALPSLNTDSIHTTSLVNEFIVEKNPSPSVPRFPQGFIPNEANLELVEENEISRFIESKSPDQDFRLPQKISVCNPVCAQNELCKSSRDEHVCVCKPGFARRQPIDKCTKTSSYQIEVVLERLSDNKLTFSPELSNKSHPNTQYLTREIAAGFDRAFSESSIGDKYHSNTILAFEQLEDDQSKNVLVTKVKIDLADDASNGLLLSSFIRPSLQPNENTIRMAIEDSLRAHNYSLGGTEVYARQQSTILDASDFDECASIQHNDCHQNARCINIVGSFLCKCEDNFKDVSTADQTPGRQCVGYRSCSFCSYHGQCIAQAAAQPICECNDWFSGDRCQMNMKVMLIVVVSLGAFLLLLFFICLAFCCLRTKKDTQKTFLRGRMAREPGTLDRRAMIADTCSESSEDLSRIPTSTLSVGVHAAGRMSKRGGAYTDANPEKGLDNPSMLTQIIPRVKGFAAPARPEKYSDHRQSSRAKSQQAVLVDILDGGPRSSRQARADLEDQVQSSCRNHLNEITQAARSRRHSQDDHLEMTVENSRSRSTSRPRRTAHNESTLRSKSTDRRPVQTNDPSEYGHNSFKYGNSVSEVRSFDETTVRVPIRSLRGESLRSRDFASSQILSEGMPTNAERDGASTIVYPQMQLYRPVRETDSMSDLTGGNHRFNQDYFE